MVHWCNATGSAVVLGQETRNQTLVSYTGTGPISYTVKFPSGMGLLGSVSDRQKCLSRARNARPKKL